MADTNRPTTRPTVRPLAEGDRAQWDTLWEGYLRFYEASRPQEIFELTWQRILTEGEDPLGLCAVDDAGRLLGIAHVMFHRSAWDVGDRCYLQDLFTVPEARGQGVGRALIEAVYAIADDRGCSQTYWLTQDFNATARLLYDRIGVLTPFIKYNRS